MIISGLMLQTFRLGRCLKVEDQINELNWWFNQLCEVFQKYSEIFFDLIKDNIDIVSAKIIIDIRRLDEGRWAYSRCRWVGHDEIVGLLEGGK